MENTHSLLEMANIYFQNKEYEKSSKYYLRALKFSKNNVTLQYAACNNLGVNYYLSGNYPLAISYFEKAIGFDCIFSSQFFSTCEALAFSLCFSEKYKKALKIINSLVSYENYEISPDTIVLFYLTNYQQYSMNLYELLQQYDLNDSCYKIVKQILNGELSKSAKDKMNVLTHYLYVPSEVFICNFYGCPKHKNSYKIK